ncbi:hypothetical protein Q8G35_17340 [Peribacillus simplex]|uniref:Uncharacterized protein n=2 Tax=Peribacillus TaxID=2675229 RepID=A0AA90PJA3_9BACI|nr:MULTISPECIES: hypothetical protein [Peribacillus]MDP1420108.1 hypothetical protein [Peribacillus simplex]MDP1454727.1 hypothetical protein [Peribacillus frigoritolerans]
MGFRFDMRNKTPQQQAIVRKNDESEKLRKEQIKKEEEIKCTAVEKTRDYEGVNFIKGTKTLLQLRVSNTALVNDPCGLKDSDAHKWLCKIGMTFIDQVKEYEVLTITSYDVLNQELTIDWKDLRRETKTTED